MVLYVYVLFINVCIYNNIVFSFHNAFDLFTNQAVFIGKLKYFVCIVLKIVKHLHFCCLTYPFLVQFTYNI